MDFELNYVFDEEKNKWLIQLTGEVDIFNSAELKKKLLDLIEEKKTDLCIDCKELVYIDSTALGALVAVLKNVKYYSGEIRLSHLRPNLSKLFKITNLDKVFVMEVDTNE